MTAATYKELGGRGDIYTAADSTARIIAEIAPRFVFLIRTACCRIHGWLTHHTRTHAHTSRHRSWLSQREKVEARLLLYRVASKYTAFEGWRGTCSRYWYTAAERKTKIYYSRGFHGRGWPWFGESDPVKKSQLARLRTPRASATEPGWGQHLRRVVPAAPLRAPQPRAREKTRGRKRRACQCAKNCISCIYMLVFCKR